MIETVETNKSGEQDGKFDRNYTEVKRLKVLIADDGTKIPFSANMKVVYAYLFTFQTNEDRRNYPEPIHPNMELIAWENGITKPTAQKAVDDLMRVGVLIKDQIQVGSGFKSNNYVVLKPSKVVARGVTPPHPNEVKSKPKKKAAQPKIEESENGVQQQEHEQQPSGVAYAPATVYPEQRSSIPLSAGDSNDDVPVNDAVNSSETPQRADLFDLKLWREGGPSSFGFMEYGKEHGETEVEKVTALIDLHYFEALIQIVIFDEDGVVTEEFINALSGDAAPNRNSDDTLQSFQYVYWVARYSQDERDGIPVRTREEYMAEARPEHFPFHLLPDREPEQDFSNETIPF